MSFTCFYMPNFIKILGIILLFGGEILFIWSHNTIGKFWNVTVDLKENHQLIMEGPYKYIRHPLYTASIISFIGTILIISTWLLAILFIIYLIAYYFMAKQEEKILLEKFGERYKEYIKNTGMFFKFI